MLNFYSNVHLYIRFSFNSAFKISTNTSLNNEFRFSFFVESRHNRKSPNVMRIKRQQSLPIPVIH